MINIQTEEKNIKAAFGTSVTVNLNIFITFLFVGGIYPVLYLVLFLVGVGVCVRKQLIKESGEAGCVFIAHNDCSYSL